MNEDPGDDPTTHKQYEPEPTIHARWTHRPTVAEVLALEVSWPDKRRPRTLAGGPVHFEDHIRGTYGCTLIRYLALVNHYLRHQLADCLAADPVTTNTLLAKAERNREARTPSTLNRKAPQ